MNMANWSDNGGRLFCVRVMQTATDLSGIGGENPIRDSFIIYRTLTIWTQKYDDRHVIFCVSGNCL
jgi:hypothetical protein